MRLIDTHAHLSDLKDREGVVHRAKGAGVDAIVAVGANLETNMATIDWAEAYNGYVYPALGIHPTEWIQDEVQTTLRYMEDNADRIVAIAEIGLDYWDKNARKNKSVREKQRQIYVEQLQMANELSKPVSVHGRGSWRDALNLAIKHGTGDVVFHWYSGPLEILTKVLDNGYLISATPAVEYSRDHRAALAEAPLERILVETDSPVYLRNRRRPSEPSDLTITVGALSKLKGLTVEEVARVTTLNAERFFRIACHDCRDK